MTDPRDAVGRDPRSGTPEASTAPVALLDIDGTLADVRHRLHHLDHRPKNWAGFFSHMERDGLLAEGHAHAHRLLASGCDIVYFTGRPEHYREVTQAWLERHGLPVGPLLMRPSRDRRPARLWKAELVHELARTREILTIVDDDPAVVAVLRGLGFPVEQVTWEALDDHGAHPEASQHEHALLLDAQESEGRT